MGLDSVFGNFGQQVNLKSESTVSAANARVARAQGLAAKGQAYGQAARIEASNAIAQQQAVDNMQRVRRNATLARGVARVQRGASGFTAQGSGLQEEVSVLERYEQTARDMAQASSLQDMEARFNAAMSRKSGDLAELSGEANYEYGMAQAEALQQQAKNAKHAGIAQIVAMVGGAAVGGATGFGSMSGAMMGSGGMSTLMSGTPGTYESGHATVSGDVFSQFMGGKLSEWLS